MKPIPPCIDCTKRHVGCHSHCDPYLDYAIRVREFNINVKKEKAKDNMLNDLEWLVYNKYHHGKQ